MEKKLLALHMYQKELLKFQKPFFCSFRQFRASIL